jgi:hypothetical protein
MILKKCQPKMAPQYLSFLNACWWITQSSKRLMIEKQINNDQNNHWHTHQPAYKIFTHDASPLKYSYNSCLLIDFGLHSCMLPKTMMMQVAKKCTGKAL